MLILCGKLKGIALKGREDIFNISSIFFHKAIDLFYSDMTLFCNILSGDGFAWT